MIGVELQADLDHRLRFLEAIELDEGVRVALAPGGMDTPPSEQRAPEREGLDGGTGVIKRARGSGDDLEVLREAGKRLDHHLLGTIRVARLEQRRR